jgi:hypothetical protein
VFAPNDSGLAVRTALSFDPGPHQLYYMSLSADGPGTSLLVHEAAEDLESPSFSHDGELLFFVAQEPGEAEHLYASEVGSGTPSAPVQLTNLPVGNVVPVAPKIVAEGVAFFEYWSDAVGDGRQLMRLSLSDWPSFEIDPVYPFNPAPQQYWWVSQDGARVLHLYGTESLDDPRFAELITIDGGVIAAPLPIDVTLSGLGAQLSPSGRYASFYAIADTPELHHVVISDLDGPSPETPTVMGTTALGHGMSDRWIAWAKPDGTVMAANLDDGVGVAMELTGAGSTDYHLTHLDDRRLYYLAPDNNYWFIDLSGDAPQPAVKVTHSVEAGQNIIVPWLLPSPIDNRAYYRTDDALDDVAQSLWASDPNLDDELELVTFDYELRARLIAPEWGVVTD